MDTFTVYRSDIFKKDVAFVLDTNFVLALLDFNSETKTDTANRIVDIANKIGIKLTILDQHLDELKNFLKRKAKEIRSFHRLELIRNDNFFGACDRRRLDKTDLQRYANNINKHILAKKIEIISDYKDGFIEKVRKSTIFQKMQSRTYNPQGAFSDAFAIEYIREERDSSTTDFFESRAWFVCYPLEDHYPHYREDGELYETIFAETLLNILWLTNPTINMQNLDDLGLRRLISETIDSALPSRGILIAIEDKMQIMTEKENPEITERDCYNASSIVAHETLQRKKTIIQDLDRVKDNDEVFAEKIKQLSKQKELKEKQIAELVELQKNQISVKDLQIKQQDNEKSNLEKENRTRIEKLERKNKLDIKLEVARVNIVSKNNFLQNLNEQYGQITKVATNSLKGVCTFLILSYFSLVTILFIHYGFVTIYPYLSFIIPSFLLFYNTITLRKFSYSVFVKKQVQINIDKISKKRKFDLSNMKHLENEISKLDEIRSDLERQLKELEK